MTTRIIFGRITFYPNLCYQMRSAWYINNKRL